jgi:alkylation response protein AidB-like acyl-CoA dehydrogenase
MAFAFTETQADLSDAARRYLADRYPPSRIAELSDGEGSDLGAWPELRRQGWLDPELGVVELTMLAEESGRALHPTPWWSTAGLALPVYQAAGAELPGPATLADGSGTCRAAAAGEGFRLDGRLPAVIDALTAAEIVVAAGVAGTPHAGGASGGRGTGAGVALFTVRPDGPGVSLAGNGGIDPLRRSSQVELAGAPARLLVGAPAAAGLLAAVERRGTAMLAGEAVGVAARALTIAVEYAKVREQFGRPIGSYQAVGHLLADGYADLELARSLTYRAACVLHDQSEDSGEALACAAYASRQAALRVCEAAIQVCGGIGVTWEHPIHRWYRRALWIDAFHAARTEPLDTLAKVVLDKNAPVRAGRA